MASTRRMGAPGSETRALLIDTAAKILTTKGAAAVTARNLAESIGLQRHIIHYYFGTIEDLLVAVLERDAERTRRWLAKALGSEEPLNVIWALGNKAAVQTLEFSVLAARSEVIREQFKKSSEEFREHLTRALELHLKAQGIKTRLPPIVITIAIQSIAYTISIEGLLGIEDGHKIMKKFTNDLISLLATHDPSG